MRRCGGCVGRAGGIRRHQRERRKAYAQRIVNAADHLVPIARRPLAKQARGRYRAIVAMKQPSPIGNERQHDPDRPTERAREVSRGGVDADDKVELGTAAAVSAKSVTSAGRSVIVPAAMLARSATRSPTCKENQRTPEISNNGTSRAKAIERLRSFLCCGLPAHTSPTSKVVPLPRRPRHRAAAAASIGSRAPRPGSFRSWLRMRAATTAAANAGQTPAAPRNRRSHRRDQRKRRRQGVGRCPHLQDHAAAAFGHARHVAHELERVTDALFGVSTMVRPASDSPRHSGCGKSRGGAPCGASATRVRANPPGSGPL